MTFCIDCLSNLLPVSAAGPEFPDASNLRLFQIFCFSVLLLQDDGTADFLY